MRIGVISDGGDGVPKPAFGHFNGPKLSRAREASGLSRSQLAEVVGVKPDVVGLWEGRGVTPAAPHLRKVALAVQLDVFELYCPPKVPDGLAALRLRAGLSQRKLAQLIATPQTTLSGWERGTSPLPVEKAARLANALGVSEGALLNVVRTHDGTDERSKRTGISDARAELAEARRDRANLLHQLSTANETIAALRHEIDLLRRPTPPIYPETDVS